MKVPLPLQFSKFSTPIHRTLSPQSSFPSDQTKSQPTNLYQPLVVSSFHQQLDHTFPRRFWMWRTRCHVSKKNYVVQSNCNGLRPRGGKTYGIRLCFFWDLWMIFRPAVFDGKDDTDGMSFFFFSEVGCLFFLLGVGQVRIFVLFYFWVDFWVLGDFCVYLAAVVCLVQFEYTYIHEFFHHNSKITNVMSSSSSQRILKFELFIQGGPRKISYKIGYIITPLMRVELTRKGFTRWFLAII